MDPITPWQERLADAGYIADPELATALYLQATLQRPLLLEGDAGVGKTEVARALSRANACRLIRLQCYEGLDVNSAVYEWNYQRQLLAIQLLASETQALESKEAQLFSDQYLLPRPLLEAISQEQPPVLLIDEIDRADEEFEAYLLEVLADFQISIPELGTRTALSIPAVILTSNGTRELSDALRRRCLYHYVDYPDFAKELRILQTRLPDLSLGLARQIVSFVQLLRQETLRKTPGIAETLDWAEALLGLHLPSLDTEPALLQRTLGCLLKTREDQQNIAPELVAQLVGRAR